MTEEELLAEEYICNGKCQDDITKNYVHCKTCTRIKDFLAGLKAGRPQLHDLRKDPNDLPKDNCMVLVRFEKPVMKFSYFCHSEKKFSAWNKEYGCNVQLHNVIAWCEIPKFKE